MDEHEKGIVRRVTQLVVPLYTAANPFRFRVVCWTVACLVLLGVDTWVNVAFSNAQRDFTNAMSEKDEDTFWEAIRRFGYLLFVASLVYAAETTAERRIRLEWRTSLTHRCLSLYFANMSYYSVSLHKHDIDNPGQRIVDDARYASESGVKLVAIILERVLNIVTFLYVLYSISPGLVLFVVLYSGAATLLSSYLFSAKVKYLEYAASKIEAGLRHLLIHIYHYREEVAFYRGGEHEKASVEEHYSNLREAILAKQQVLLLVECFKRCFSYLTVLLPYIVTADRYFAGTMTFGEVTQVGTAFYHIRSGLGMAVSQLERLSTTCTHFERLGALIDALEQSSCTTQGPASPDMHEPAAYRLKQNMVTTVSRRDTLEVQNLTVHVPDAPGSPGAVVCKNLSFVLSRGGKLLVRGPNGCGKTSLFRAVCGLFTQGSGVIQIPEKTFVLPQKIYMPYGAGLRQQLCYPDVCQPEHAENDGVLVDLLHKVGLGGLPKRTKGWDTEHDFASILSPGEQQRIGFVRLLRTRPRAALLDESTSAVDEGSEAHLYSLLAKAVPTFVTIGHRKSLLKYHTHVLSYVDNCEWRLLTTETYEKSLT